VATVVLAGLAWHSLRAYRSRQRGLESLPQGRRQRGGAA